MKVLSKNRIYLILIISALLIMASISFFVSLGRPEERELSLKRDFLAEDSNISTDIHFQEGDGSIWTKPVIDDGRKMTAGVVYEATITNLSNGEIKDWSMKVVANDITYLNNAWCGTVEVHQESTGLVQTLDLRSVKNEDITLSYLDKDKDLLIRLEPGDYFIYYPSKSSSETPLEVGQKTTVGFILYSTDLKNFFDFDGSTLTYTSIKDIKSMPEYYSIMVLLGLLVLILLYYLVDYVRYRQIRALYEKEKRTVQETMATFVGFVDAKDPYTAGHSERVAEYTKMIAEKIGYSEDEALQAYYCGILHDIGKVYVSGKVLNKPGRLTAEEFEVIKTHTTTGYDILSKLSTVPNAAKAARHHHERYDGTGYPDRLSGKDIPEIARIICVADSFDAMNSNRVYRNALSKEQILEQLTVHSGTQFDPKIAEVFLELLKDGKIENFK